MPLDFLRTDMREMRKISFFTLRRPIVVTPATTLLEMLNLFQRGSSHMAIVASDTQAVMSSWKENMPIPGAVEIFGIITYKDILERCEKKSNHFHL